MSDIKATSTLRETDESVLLYCESVNLNYNNHYEVLFDFAHDIDIQKVSQVTNISINNDDVNDSVTSMLISIENTSENIKTLPEENEWYRIPLSVIKTLNENVLYPDNSLIQIQLKW